MQKSSLYHHGIKGQKWGSRNGPPYPLAPEDHSAREKKEKWQYSLKNPKKISRLGEISEYTAEAGRLSFRKSKKKSGNASAASSKTTGPMKERVLSPFKKTGIMAQNGIDTKDIKVAKLMTFRRLADDGIKVAKGSVVQHVMSTPVKDMTGRDYLFVAATDADKKNYAGYFAALTKYRNKVDQMYVMKMKANTDLISPGKKERVQTFIDIYKDNPVRVARQLAEFNKRNYAGQYKESVEELTKKYSHMSKRELKGMGYYTYANSWFDPEAGTLSDMRSRLEKKGYNAIIDDNDKRSFIQSQAPLIVFNVMDNLGDVRVEKLSDGQIRRNMIDWQYMKHSDQELRELIDMSINVELYHHGVKGQKWGIRRYRNLDGTLTSLGKRRNSESSQLDKKNEFLTKTNIDKVNEINRNTKNIVTELNTANKRAAKKDTERRTTRLDLSNKTDAELRAEINRELLERQYNQVFNSPNVSIGRERVSDILESAGTALAVTGSVLSIALSIKQLRS